MICIVCPVGCRLEVKKDEGNESGYLVTGNLCKRGVEYGIKEMTNPTRVLTTTVKIKDSLLERLPVRTNGEIPKDRVFACMKIIDEIEVKAPVRIGKVVFGNLSGTGIDLIASRSMERVFE